MTTMFHYLKQAAEQGVTEFRIDSGVQDEKGIHFTIHPIGAEQDGVIADFVAQAGTQVVYNTAWQGEFKKTQQPDVKEVETQTSGESASGVTEQVADQQATEDTNSSQSAEPAKEQAGESANSSEAGNDSSEEGSASSGLTDTEE